MYLDHLQLVHCTFACVSHSVLSSSSCPHSLLVLVLVFVLPAGRRRRGLDVLGRALRGRRRRDCQRRGGVEAAGTVHLCIRLSSAYGGRSEMRVSCNKHSVVSPRKTETDKHTLGITCFLAIRAFSATDCVIISHMFICVYASSAGRQGPRADPRGGGQDWRSRHHVGRAGAVSHYLSAAEVFLANMDAASYVMCPMMCMMCPMCCVLSVVCLH